jgi:hypothetical protein
MHFLFVVRVVNTQPGANYQLVLTKGEYVIHRPQILKQLRAQYFALMKHVRETFLRDCEKLVVESYDALFPQENLTATVCLKSFIIIAVFL